MKPWQFAIASLALLALAGCRTDPAVPVLERELRLKEDEIYRLRDCVERLRDESQACQQRADRSGRSGQAEENDTAPRRSSGSATGNGVKPPVIEGLSQPTGKVPDILKLPAGEGPSGVPAVPDELQRPAKPNASKLDGPSLEKSIVPGTRAVQTGMDRSLDEDNLSVANATPFTPSGDSRRVHSIRLNRDLTGGINTGDGGGDQGLLVVIEPRDRAGRPLDAPAEVSVVVLDHALQGEAARVARWDFSAAETAAMFRRTAVGQAIHLTTTWPGDPPQHGDLQLHVRYVTIDGRKLEASQPVEVALPGDKTARRAASGRAEEASDSWRRNDAPTARVPGPSPVSRSDSARRTRPAWSPERQ